MSWDVMVFNFHGDPPKDLDLMPDEGSLEALGPAERVREAISRTLLGVDWSDPTWGMYAGDGFTFEFNTGRDDPIVAIMVHVRGGDDAIAALLRFAVPNQWSLFDCSTSEFIDPNEPSQEGWEGFQAYRDTVVKQHRGTDDS
jgi:hypothetical protein